MQSDVRIMVFLVMWPDLRHSITVDFSVTFFSVMATSNVESDNGCHGEQKTWISLFGCPVCSKIVIYQWDTC